MISIMLSSDWHVDASTAGVNRFAELSERIEWLVEEAINNKVEHFMFLGDYQDPDACEWYKYQDLLVRVVVKLSQAGIRSHWLQGNHDVVKALSEHSTLSIVRTVSEALKVKPYFYNRPTCKPRDITEGQPFNLVALPYPSLATYNNDLCVANDVMKFASLCNASAPTIVISHMQIKGMVPGSESGDMARGLDHELPFDRLRLLPNVRVYQGHYHRHQTVQREGVEVVVVGSLARLHFDEEDHNPGYMMVKL